FRLAHSPPPKVAQSYWGKIAIYRFAAQAPTHPDHPWMADAGRATPLPTRSRWAQHGQPQPAQAPGWPQEYLPDTDRPGAEPSISPPDPMLSRNPVTMKAIRPPLPRAALVVRFAPDL